MAISAKDAVKKFKVELLQELPLDEPLFFAMAERAGLFPMGFNKSVKAEKTRAHKVDYFLDHVVEPGADEYLPKLLKVMRESKIANVVRLANNIQAAVGSDASQKMQKCEGIDELSECVKKIYNNERTEFKNDILLLQHPRYFENRLSICHKECCREDEISTSVIRHGPISSKDNVLMDSGSMYDTKEGRFLDWLEYSIMHIKVIKSLKPIEEISDIFQPFTNDTTDFQIDPKFIIIEGASGMGKTTLCKEITYRWLEKHLLEDTKLLLLICLRDPATSKIKKLQDFIHHFYKGDSNSLKQFSEIIHKKNDDVTIILDGLNEFDLSTDSFIVDILKRKVLSQCRIIVTTSHLNGSTQLCKGADVRVEVLGFTDECKDQYIEEALKNHPNAKEKLQSYLEENQPMKSICCKPIIMALLIYVFTVKEFLPKNSTELYEYFILLKIFEKQKERVDAVVSIEALPEKWKDILLDLSQFAFVTLKKNQTVFSKDNIKTYCPDSKLLTLDICSLGIIIPVEHCGADKSNFCFLHLSIHTYLSAYYVNENMKYKKFKMLTSTFLNETYQETWNMFTSMNKNKSAWLNFDLYHIYCDKNYSEPLSDWMKKVKSSNFECFVQLYDIILNANTKRSDVQIIFFHSGSSCDEYNMHQKHMYLSLCNRKDSHQYKLKLFVIDECTEDLHWCKKLTEETNLITRFSLVLFVGNVLILDRANEQEIIDFLNCKTSLTQITLINCHISKKIMSKIKDSNLQCLLHLKIVCCSFDHGAFMKLSECLRKLPALSVLEFESVSPSLSVEQTTVHSFVAHNNQNLQTDEIISNHPHSEIIKVADELKHIKTLEKLILTDCNISPVEATAINHIITSNTSLKVFCIGRNLLKSSVNLILKSLSNIRTLERLEFHNNQIPEEAGDALASVIRENSQLKYLVLNDNNIGKGVVHITKALQDLNSLQELNLGKTKIPKEACLELTKAIECNLSLKNFQLYENNLELSAIGILEALKKLSSLTVLDLQDCHLNENTGYYLSCVIKKNTGLSKLLLNDNNIGKGILDISKALQQVGSLQVLALGNINIPEDVTDELALAIEHNQCLNMIQLYNNNLKCSSNRILEALSNLKSLTVLDLQTNHLTEEASKYIESIILNNTGLNQLLLHNNNFGNGILCIAKALQKVSSLQVLAFGNTYLPKEVLDEVAVAVSSNQCLNFFRLSGINLHDSESILKSLSLISSIKYLNLFGTTVSEKASIYLASIITGNELQALGLNFVTTPIRIIKALHNISTLKALVIDSTSVSEEAEVQLASVIMNNKSLERLSLANINLSNNFVLQAIATVSKLTLLWLEDNLLSEEISDSLALAISKNTSLRTLILLDNMLQMGLIKVAEACNQLSNIKVLQFAHNSIDFRNVDKLGSTISKCPSLEKVMLGGIVLNAEEAFNFNISKVWKKILHNLHVTNSNLSLNCSIALEIIYLEIQRKQIDSVTKCFDCEFWSNTKNFIFIHKLSHIFEDQNITEPNFSSAEQKLLQVNALRLIGSFDMFDKLKVIDLENSNIDEHAACELAPALNNNMLEQLWLRGNKLNTTGAKHILESLDHLNTLQVLDLSYNNIGGESASSTVRAIDKNHSLKQLWLDGNNLGNEGTKNICSALKNLKHLNILSLCDNGITDDAADELSAVIIQNVLLEDLLLSNNQLHSTGIKIIAESLSKLIKLRKLDLFNNDIGEEGASSLANAVKNSSSLQDLFLSSNNLETSGALKICNALSCINSLHVLTLSNNNISDEVTQQIIGVLNNNHLYTLLIGGNGLECGGLEIAEIIKNDNIAMQLLDFSNNNISEQDKETIKKMFSKRANFCLYV